MPKKLILSDLIYIAYLVLSIDKSNWLNIDHIIIKKLMYFFKEIHIVVFSYKVWYFKKAFIYIYFYIYTFSIFLFHILLRKYISMFLHPCFCVFVFVLYKI